MMDLSVLTKFLSKLMGAFFLVYLQRRLLQPRQDRPWRSIAYYVLVMYNYCLTPDAYFDSLQSEFWLAVIDILCVVLAGVLLWTGFRGSFIQNYFLTAISYMSEMLPQPMLIGCLSLLGLDTWFISVNDLSQLPQWALVLAVYFLVVYGFYRFFLYIRPKLEQQKWAMIAFCLANFFILDFLNAVFRIKIVLGKLEISVANEPYNMFIHVQAHWNRIAIVCLLVVLGAVLYSRHQLNRQKAEMTQRLLQQQCDSYLQLEEASAVLHRQHHDILNHMVVLQAMASASDLPGLRRYLGELTKEYSSCGPETHYCDHHTVNSILVSKMRQCNQEGIDAQFLVRLPERLQIRDMDLVCVFSNLLDNAIESCRKCPEGVPREIALAAGLQGDMLVLTISNSCISNVNLVRGSSKPHQRNHGWGLKILRDVAGRYDGHFTIRQRENRVEASMILSNLPQKAMASSVQNKGVSQNKF